MFNKLDSLQKATILPVGFDSSIVKLAIGNRENKPPEINTFWFWFWKIIGVLISGFAASLGAPFWFDVLKKAYSVKL